MRIRRDFWSLCCLWGSVVFLVAMCMFPPWRTTRGNLFYAPLWRPPPSFPFAGIKRAIDSSRLVLELISGEAIIGALFLTFRKK